jgi:seryl-tRNA synthetase
LASNYFSIKEFDYLLAEKNDLAAEISLLKTQQEKDRQKIAELTYALGKALERINDLVLFTKGYKENINLTLLVNPNIDSFDVENSKNDFCKLYPNIKLDDLKNKNIGITNEQQIQLVNFAPIFYTKK